MKTKSVPTRSTYVTDCMRRITDEETGEKRVARFEETRAVSVTLAMHDGNVFHNGARIA